MEKKQHVRCKAAIRTDRWAQLLRINQEIEQEGVGQAWHCHCGTKYTPGKGSALVEWIDFDAVPQQARHFVAAHPQYDIKDLKTLCREA
eukprot:591859-Pyramimonas_sp.AAC.1